MDFLLEQWKMVKIGVHLWLRKLSQKIKSSTILDQAAERCPNVLYDMIWYEEAGKLSA